MISVYEGLKPLFDGLEILKIPYAVVGSFASSSWGQPRHTNDIDIVVAMGPVHIQPLIETFETSYFLDPVEIEHTLESKDPYRAFQLIHKETNFKFDMFVPPLDDFSYGVLKRAKKIELLPGVFARCETSEDAVIGKLRWFDLGHRKSDRQWNDIVQVLEIRKGLMDEEYLRNWAQHFRLLDLLEKAMAEVT
ncbi:MAG: hypothetical protein ACAH95_12985 [Fimbriimonas sp.]